MQPSLTFRGEGNIKFIMILTFSLLASVVSCIILAHIDHASCWPMLSLSCIVGVVGGLVNIIILFSFSIDTHRSVRVYNVIEYLIRPEERAPLFI